VAATLTAVVNGRKQSEIDELLTWSSPGSVVCSEDSSRRLAVIGSKCAAPMVR